MDNKNIAYLEHCNECLECRKITSRYDTSIASFICSEECSKSWEDRFQKWCRDEEKKQKDEIIGLRLGIDVLTGIMSPEEAQMTLETVQNEITQLLIDKGLCPAGGTGEFLFEGEYYSTPENKKIINEAVKDICL